MEYTNLNKELLITLIKKDISELLSLTGGFEQMESIPSVLLDLSLEKATQLHDNLASLSVISTSISANKPMTDPVKLAVEKSVLDCSEKLSGGTCEVNVHEKDFSACEARKAQVLENVAVATKELAALEAKEKEPTMDAEIFEETGLNINGWMDEPDGDSDDTNAESRVTNEPSESCSSSVEDRSVNDDAAQLLSDAIDRLGDCQSSVSSCSNQSAATTISESDRMEQEEALDDMESSSEEYILTSDVELKEAASLAHEINGTPQKVEEEPEVERPVAIAEQSVTRLADTIDKTESLAQSLGVKSDASVNSTLQHKPITDLKSAITIADRFRFQRELFAGDGEMMMKTIGLLNNMKSLDQAQEYLKKYFNWSEQNSAVVDFMTLLERRYL